jgi:hypothetical protein
MRASGRPVPHRLVAGTGEPRIRSRSDSCVAKVERLRFSRFLMTVIVAGLLLVVARALSVARAVSLYVPAAPVFH